MTRADGSASVQLGSGGAGGEIRPGPPAAPRAGSTLRSRSVVGAGERCAAGVVAAACLSVLVIAAMLRPDPAGHGTHEQMGLPRCGWVVALGLPCPTCGMTTAFAEAAEGDFPASVVVQPFGALLAVGTAGAFWASLHVAVFGSRVGRVCGKLLRPRVLWTVAGLWGASWVYKLLTWTG